MHVIDRIPVVGQAESSEASLGAETRAQLYGAILDQVTDAVAIIDPSGLYLEQNRVHAALIGYSDEDLRGQTPALHLGHEATGEIMAELRAVGTYRGEVESRTKQGEHKSLELSAFVMRNSQGLPLCYVGMMRDMTGRRRTEEALLGVRGALERERQEKEYQDAARAALEENDRRQRFLLEQIPAVLWATDSTLRFTLSTGSGLKHLGLKPDQVVGMTLMEYFQVEDPEALPIAKVRQALAGEPARFHHDQEGMTFDTIVEPLHGTDGRIVGAIGLSQDITEHRRIQAALIEREERLALAAEGSSVSLWDGRCLPGKHWSDPDNPIWWSPKIREILALEPGEPFNTLGLWASRLHQDDLGFVMEALTAHAERRTPFDVQYRLRTNRGDYRWIRGRGLAMWDELGRPYRMAGSCLDLTEQKQAEEALRESEERYRQLADLSPMGMYVYCEGRTAYVNQAACRIMRAASPEDLLCRPTMEFVHPDSREAVIESARCLLEGGEPVRRADRKYIRLDGRVIDVEVQAGPIMWNGKPAIQGIFSDVTARMASERVRREHHLLLSAIMDAALDVIYVKDLNGRYLHMNRAGLQILEMSVETVVGRTDQDLYPAELAQQCAASDRQVLATGASVTVEEAAVISGSRRVYLTIKAPYRDQDGTIIGVIGASRDITARKETEQALRASEELFSKAFRSSPYPIVLSELATGICLDANDAALMLFGYRREEVTGRTAHELRLWPAESVRKQFVEHVKREGSLRNIEVSLRRKDGAWRRVLVSAEIIELRGVPCMVTIGHDVTEQKHAEDALRVSEERFRAAFHNAAIGMVLGGHDGITGIEDANQAFCSLLGYGEKELSGVELQAITHPQDVAKIRGLLGKLLSGEITNTTIEQRFVRKDGGTLWALSSVSGIRDEGGQFINLLTLVQDITERKRLEVAQEHLIQELSRSQQHFKTLFNWTPSAVGISTLAEGRLIDVNEGFLRLTGYAREEVIGQTTLELGLWADPADRVAALKEFQERGSLCNREGVLRTKSGELRILMMSVDPIRIGSTPCLIYLAHDITERKQEEEVFRLAKFSVEHAVDAVYWVDAQAGILDVNQAACAMLGYSRAELCAMAVHAINPSFHADMWPAFWAEVKERGTASLETYHRAKNGRTIPVEIRVNHLSYGSHEYHCAFVRNVTERKRAEDLRAAESKIFEAIARHQPLEKVLSLLCRTVEEACEDIRCSILLLDSDGIHLRTAAAPSLPEEYSRAIDGIAIGPNVGSCGTAAYRNQPVFVADTECDPLWRDFRDLALRYGLRACWSTPICTAEKKVLGTFALYAASAPRLPSAHEINVVERMTHLAAFAIDRLRSEEALRQSRASLRRITDAIPGVVYQYRVGPDGTQNFLFASRGTEELLGCEPAELEADARIGWSAVLPEDIDALQASIQASAAELTPWTQEFRVRAADGQVKWLHGSSLPERQEDGATVWYGLFTDVTARREAEQQLRLTQFAMDHAADAIIWAGPDRRLVYANEEACRSLGYSKREILQLSISDIAPQHDPVRFEQRLALLRQGQTDQYQSIHRARDGREFPVEVSIRYLEHQGVGYVCGIARDITERKELDRQLRHTDRLATLGTITAGVAHELNNPLFVITGHLHLIERKLVRRQLKALRKELMAAQDAAERATKIVSRFLNTAHGSVDVREPCDVPEVMEQALVLMRNEFRVRHIHVECCMASAVPSVSADPQALSQVFLNLLTNACQALEPDSGAGLISIEVRATDLQGLVWVECLIRDNGPGIPPDLLPRIFDPFFTTKPVGEGTGLGLAICHRIISELSGTLTCESRFGEGATFTVRLPASGSSAPLQSLRRSARRRKG